MDEALYHPIHGYYRRRHNPFGKGGDFFTAEQLQPVYGILMAERVAALYRQMGEPAEFTIVELGSGRGEMADAFARWRYVPVEHEKGELPDRFTGIVFANEFFDALPVDCVVRSQKRLRELRVGWEGDRFSWVVGEPASPEITAYAEAWLPSLVEGARCEVNLDALHWIDRIARSLTSGYAMTIDYGYTRAEAARFFSGTLMSYRRHAALEDVLADPGGRDITAHVNFSALCGHGSSRGLETASLETLAQTLLAAGEGDQFAAALAGSSLQEEQHRRLQLKTLLFGMGESFRVLLQRRA